VLGLPEKQMLLLLFLLDQSCLMFQKTCLMRETVEVDEFWLKEHPMEDDKLVCLGEQISLKLKVWQWALIQ